MSSASLQLIDSNRMDVSSFERRRTSRHAVAGRVTAVQLPPATGGHRSRICSLELINMSDSGMGVISSEPITVHSSITIFFPPHGPEHGFDLYGRVVRCMPCVEDRQGHMVGIRFEERQAA